MGLGLHRLRRRALLARLLSETSRASRRPHQTRHRRGVPVRPMRLYPAQMNRLLVTSALPYANGHIHIGHLVEYMQTDIWVRASSGCGATAPSTSAPTTPTAPPIMIRARQEGRSEVELIAEMSEAHQRDFAQFRDRIRSLRQHPQRGEPRRSAGEIWAALRAATWSRKRRSSSSSTRSRALFLADRFVRGTCPRCGPKDQYGDNCGTSAGDLWSGRSRRSGEHHLGARPEIRAAKHLFVRIEKMHDFLASGRRSGTDADGEIATT
jgi:methionyl-tRNA synthetase